MAGGEDPGHPQHETRWPETTPAGGQLEGHATTQSKVWAQREGSSREGGSRQGSSR